MSDMDVSLRLRLINQLKRPAEEAERDLKDLKKAADQLGHTKAGDGMARDLNAVGRAADEAKRKIGTIRGEATDAKLAIARIGDGFGGFRADANNATQALTGIKREAAEAKAAIGRVGDGAFADLKSNAASAEQALQRVGQAADTADQKIRTMQGKPWQVGNPIRSGVGHGGTGGGLMTAAEGAVDQFGVPLAVGAGGAYLAGALPAGAAVAAGAAVNAAGKDEFTSDQLRVLGQYGPDAQARYDQQMAIIGARKGVGTQGAQSVFGLLMSGGLDADNSAAMTENAIVFGKATQASPDDAARTTIALKNTFGIGSDKMMNAYDAMALGGKEGQFEVPDMAKNFPSIASKMSALGEGGMDGTRLAVALGQAIRKTAGSSDEASTNFENMLGKFRAQDFIKNASEIGINVEKVLKGAQAKGQSPILSLLDVIKKKVGTDGFKLAELMPDVQSLAGLEASLKDLDEVRAMIERMKASEGTVSKDYDDATNNFSSQKDRLGANVGQNIKDSASPLLPGLTGGARWLSERSETWRENQQKNPLLNSPMAGPTQGMLKLWLDQGGANRPSSWSKFLWGEAAEPGFNFRDHHKKTMGLTPSPSSGSDGADLGKSTGVIPTPTPRPQDLGAVARDSMNSYREALTTEGAKAEGEAQGIADRIRAMFGFTVSPTIAPAYVAPTAAPVAAPVGKQSSIQQSSSFKLTQNISSPNSQMAAVRSRRAQDRAIRQAQARSQYDIGRNLA
jgi:TP901 family phage tail tape measure protein